MENLTGVLASLAGEKGVAEEMTSWNPELVELALGTRTGPALIEDTAMTEVDSLEVTTGNADVTGDEVTTCASDIGALDDGTLDDSTLDCRATVCDSDSGAWAAGVESGFRDE
jgi:hypothetical protein